MQNGEPDYGEASHTVVRSCPHIHLAVNHKVFYDNFFSGILLLTYLAKKGLHSVATVHTNSLADYKLLPGKQMEKCGRGTMIEKSAIADGVAIHAVLWYYMSIRIFNKLPDCIARLVENKRSFISTLRQYLVSKSFYSVEEFFDD